MSVTVNSYSVTDGLLIIDSSVTSPANYKIHTFYVLCNGHYADEVVPFWDRVNPPYQQVMTAANRRSYIDLSIFPNGSQTFSVRCKHAKTISPVGSIIEDTPVDVVVENTSFRTLLTPLATSYPMGVVQRPIITDFTVPASVESATIPVSITAEDNVAVAAYMVNESATPPLAGAAGWAASAPTSYTVGASGTKTLYAWAKDADGNVSEPVSATVTATFTAQNNGTTAAVGTEAVAQAGQAAATGSATSQAAGVQALVETGTATARGTATVAATGAEGVAQIGTAVASSAQAATAAATGFQATAEAGTATAHGDGTVMALLSVEINCEYGTATAATSQPALTPAFYLRDAQGRMFGLRDNQGRTLAFKQV